MANVSFDFTSNGLEKLNDHLSSRSYIDGYQASFHDGRIALKLPNGVESRFVHASRWFNHITALRVLGTFRLPTPEELKAFDEEQAAKQRKPVAAADDDDESSEEEFDAPGDDDDVDAYMAKVAAARAERAARKAAKASKKKPPPPESDDEEFDAPGDDDDVDTYMAMVAAKKAERAARKAGKSGASAAPAAATPAVAPAAAPAAAAAAPAGGSIAELIIDVTATDGDEDMGVFEKRVRSASKPGLKWLTSEVVPLAFGIKMLRINAHIVESQVTTDDVESAIRSVGGVQNTDVISYQKVEVVEAKPAKAEKKEEAAAPAAGPVAEVVLEVTPTDGDEDFKVFEARVRTAARNGLTWLTSEVVPLAFGIKMLRINAHIVEGLTSSDDVETAVRAVGGVQNTDIVSYQKLETAPEPKPAKAAKAEAKTETKAEAPAEGPKAELIIEVSPTDGDEDMAVFEKRVRTASKPGLTWLTSEIVPLAFGIKMLRINAHIVESQVSTDDVENAIRSVGGVQNTDVVSYQKL